MRTEFIPEEMLIVSEELEPTFARVIGKFFAQCEHLRETHSAECVFFVDACDSWWWTMEAMNKMTVGISSAIHASIAIRKLQVKVYGHHSVENRKFRRASLILYILLLVFFIGCAVVAGIIFN